MVDFKKALDNKKELVIEGHRWEKLFIPSDGLRIELQQVFSKKDKDSAGSTGKEYVYVYSYPDLLGFTGKPNTKYGTQLTLSKDQIENNLEKGIFTIKEKHAAEKASTEKEVGVHETKAPEIGKQQHLF